MSGVPLHTVAVEPLSSTPGGCAHRGPEDAR